ncbi:MAG TPA: chromate resistance protein ChrB domain-containing protein [Acidimicrobiia bacterium]|nr:chromate resistance protein ChrB domain-containing protein [Acidimicrobiia bacterium]
MKWATRPGVHVDRAASAWLIRRFIDPDAQFVFVDDPGEIPPDATPFDMIGVDLTHHGDRVTFETILDRYQLDDPVLSQLGRIIHEADVADELYDAPEAPGLDAVIRGLSLTEADSDIVALTVPLFDGLYAWLHRRQPG